MLLNGVQREHVRRHVLVILVVTLAVNFARARPRKVERLVKQPDALHLMTTVPFLFRAGSDELFGQDALLNHDGDEGMEAAEIGFDVVVETLRAHENGHTCF